MQNHLTIEDKKKIAEGLREKYAKVAVNPEGLFRYPTGRAGLEALHYPADIVHSLPEDALQSFCGVGNPFSLGEIREGESVLDIGCGTGVDTMIASIMVGPTGSVVGLDVSSEMLARARKNLSLTELGNVAFWEGSAEDLPFPDRSFDVVISSGVFNLVPDKAKAAEEVFRVMKDGGRLMMADQALTGNLPTELKARLDSWAG